MTIDDCLAMALAFRFISLGQFTGCVQDVKLRMVVLLLPPPPAVDPLALAPCTIASQLFVCGVDMERKILVMANAPRSISTTTANGADTPLSDAIFRRIGLQLVVN